MASEPATAVPAFSTEEFEGHRGEAGQENEVPVNLCLPMHDMVVAIYSSNHIHALWLKEVYEQNVPAVRAALEQFFKKLATRYPTSTDSSSSPSSSATTTTATNANNGDQPDSQEQKLYGMVYGAANDKIHIELDKSTHDQARQCGLNLKDKDWGYATYAQVRPPTRTKAGMVMRFGPGQEIKQQYCPSRWSYDIYEF